MDSAIRAAGRELPQAPTVRPGAGPRATDCDAVGESVNLWNRKQEVRFHGPKKPRPQAALRGRRGEHWSGAYVGTRAPERSRNSPAPPTRAMAEWDPAPWPLRAGRIAAGPPSKA